MKSTFIAIIACLAASIAPIFAEDPLPTIRENKEWIIISGIGFEDKGPLPWTHAIRKDTILSVIIQPEPNILYPDGVAGGKKFHGTPKDEITKLAARIEITTSELAPSEGSTNKRYIIQGLTNATAPGILEKILGTVDKTTFTGDPK